VPDHVLKAERRLPGLALPAAMWLFFSAVYILLLSNQYAAVDGALRCLAVYWHRPPYLGPNNHLLYPVNVRLWAHFAAVAGVHPRTPADFLRMTAALNALGAGGSVALVEVLVWRFTRDWKSALLAAVAYAFSWALLLHATSSAEPIVGLFISLVAVLVTTAGLARRRFALLFTGGICLAFALANYESMFLAAALLYLLCLVWPDGTAVSGRGTWFLLPIRRVLALMLGTAAGVIGIYGVAYHSIGITAPHAMLRAFFRIGGEPAVYGGWRTSKLANLPAGLVNNLIGVLPADYQGIRWLLHIDHAASAAALMLVLVLLASALLMLARSAAELCRTHRATVFAVVCCGGFLFELLPLAYWDPLYSKLWLQPLAFMAVFGGVLASRMDRVSARRLGALVLLIIALELIVNLPQALYAHIEPTRCLDDTLKVAKLIGLRDKVVTDFDPVSSLWMGLYDRDPARTLLFPAVAASTSLPTLDRWTGECEHSGCRILFVALLDQSREVWEAFLGKRLRVPYDSLARYRWASRSINRFSCEPGSLRVYEPAAMQSMVH
jgi:hypothetical protein